MAIPCEQPKAALLSFHLTHQKLFHVKQARRFLRRACFFCSKKLLIHPMLMRGRAQAF